MAARSPKYDAIRAKIDELSVGDFILVGSKWREVIRIVRREDAGFVDTLFFKKTVNANNRTYHGSALPDETWFHRYQFGTYIRAAAKRGEPRPEPRPFVYFAQSGDLVKIGFSRWVRKRLRVVKGESKCERLRLLAAIPGGRETEAELHTRFAHLRQHGEWFLMDESLRAFIQEQTQ